MAEDYERWILVPRDCGMLCDNAGLPFFCCSCFLSDIVLLWWMICCAMATRVNNVHPQQARQTIIRCRCVLTSRYVLMRGRVEIQEQDGGDVDGANAGEGSGEQESWKLRFNSTSSCRQHSSRTGRRTMS